MVTFTFFANWVGGVPMGLAYAWLNNIQESSFTTTKKI